MFDIYEVHEDHRTNNDERREPNRDRTEVEFEDFVDLAFELGGEG